jgi:hypothetical protein
MSFTALKHHNTLEAYQREMEHEKQSASSTPTETPQSGTSSALLGTQ